MIKIISHSLCFAHKLIINDLKYDFHVLAIAKQSKAKQNKLECDNLKLTSL